jgi:hypothetical protein
MNRQWMYDDRQSNEFINDMHSFIGGLRQTSRMVLYLVLVLSVRIRRITLIQIPYTTT